MSFRTGLFVALLVAASGPLAAEPTASEPCNSAEARIYDGPGAPPPCGKPHSLSPVVHTDAGPGPLGDIMVGRGPDAYARELERIAGAAAAGDRTKVEILSRQLRASGVSREEIDDAAAQMWPRTHVHGTPAADKEFAVRDSRQERRGS